jgi:hypothetical protein
VFPGRKRFFPQARQDDRLLAKALGALQAAFDIALEALAARLVFRAAFEAIVVIKQIPWQALLAALACRLQVASADIAKTIGAFGQGLIGRHQPEAFAVAAARIADQPALDAFFLQAGQRVIVFFALPLAL